MMQRSARKAAVGIRVALALAVGVAAGAAHATTTLVINELLPPADAFNLQILHPWATAVEQATDGRVRISLPNAPLAAPAQLWGAVTSGIVDGAYAFNSLLPRQLPLEQVAALPFSSGTTESTSLALWNTYQKYFAKAGEYKDVKLLALFALPPSEIFSMGKPIVNPGDLNGRRLWALPGVPQRIFARSKAGVVSTPAVQVSELVAGGTVDAVAGIGSYAAQSFKIIGYMKSETLIPGGLTTPCFSLIVNRAKWDSISPDDRKTIERLSGAAFARRLAIEDKLDGEARAKAEKSGVTIEHASPALMDELRSLAQPLFTQWLKAAADHHVDGPAALHYFQTQAQAKAK